MSEDLIRTFRLSKDYPMGGLTVAALSEVTFSVRKGEFVAVMGPSGSGKSTLMNILGCLDRPSSGEYILGDRKVSRISNNDLAEMRGKEIGFVFQNFNLLPDRNAFENVELPLTYRATSAREREPRVLQLLESVGLAHRRSHKPSELSGGERQRVAIARALANHPRLLLADEPTGNLDSESSRAIMKILQTLHQNQITILLITHDPDIARCAHRMIALRDGRIEKDETLGSC